MGIREIHTCDRCGQDSDDSKGYVFVTIGMAFAKDLPWTFLDNAYLCKSCKGQWLDVFRMVAKGKQDDQNEL